jgi:hypothetical protein
LRSTGIRPDVELNLDRAEKLDATPSRGLPIAGAPQSPRIEQGKP